MIFRVMSQNEAKKYSSEFHEESSAIISITNKEDPKVNFFKKANIKKILRLSFDDVEFGDKIGQSITKEDAEKIVSFVDFCINKKVKLLIVHCTAGVSRSAGVCAGIMKALTGDDMQIFEDGKYCPNMTCYSTVLGAFMCQEDEEETCQKTKLNINKWRELNEI